MEKFIHEIKLTEESEFSKRFNIVSDYFDKWQEEPTDENWNNFFTAKYALEQGLPIAEPTTLSQ